MAEIRTFQSEHYKISPKRWWHPKDRRAARLSLRVLEAHHSEVTDEYRKTISRALGYGVEGD